MRRAVFVLLVPCMGAFASPVKNCGDLAAMSFGPEVKIESAKLISATPRMPEHCDIGGVIWPENHFAVKLPTNWNERFQMVGNGGWAGVISLPQVDAAVRAGYASTSTDTGHDEKKEPGASFAYPGPNNPNAERKVVDFGYLAVHETALLAKKMIQAYYGADPKYSYWVGCSTGGREGLMEAQRYPEDFDGYVVGAPVLDLAGLQAKSVYNYQIAGQGPAEITREKAALLTKQYLDKCDASDGVKDGVVENPLKCGFDPEKDLTRCSGETDGAGCFTGPQIEALKKIYAGVHDSQGNLLFPGMPAGGNGGVAQGFNLSKSFMEFMAFDPPAGPNWDYRTFNVDTDWPRLTAIRLRIDATITDLSAVKARGGKILQYHGWSDPGVSPEMSINYYQAVKSKLGSKETDDFYRLFLVPGMGHCQGGAAACSNVDWLGAMVNWLEKGVAPTALVGSHLEQGQTTRTRPICAYPNQAQYKGSGSIDDVANFACSGASEQALRASQ
ncbi:MAG: tannase/feruloyl esterase family alpha/beta hydrolase [Bryobacteraceae bacterium]